MSKQTQMETRVAKALVERIGSPWPWEKMDPIIQALWIGHAKAAIRSMREPTKKMLRDGYDNGMGGWGEGEECEPIWVAMIDSASPPEKPDA